MANRTTVNSGELEHQHEERTDNERFDRHGVPRCRHCGAPTEFVRFTHEPTPRLQVRCLAAKTADCGSGVSVACSHDWRALLLLWRNDPVYMELRATHSEYEATHDYWRDRYKVGAAGLGQRPKRRGLEWQQLRASAALVIEWLRISEREGWLGNPRCNRRNARVTLDKGEAAATRLRQFRTKIGLNAPYGPTAARVYRTREYRRTPHERWQVLQRWDARCKQREAEAKETAQGGGLAAALLFFGK